MSTQYVVYPASRGGGGGGGSGITSINTDSTAAQVLATGTAGTDFAIVDNGAGTHTFNIPTASASNTGKLSSADWTTFNGKQASGNYITALTGDVTAAGPGSVASTLATVNSNVGSFGTASNVSTVTVSGKGLVTAASNTPIQIAESQVTNLTTDLAAKQSTTLTNTHILVGNVSNVATDVAMSGDATLDNTGAITLASVASAGTTGSSTSIPAITINAKGLVTSVSGNAVVAPASTLTGTTLASNVVTSSLTTVGTIGTGVWNGTIVDVSHGGSGVGSSTAYAVLCGGTTSTGAHQSVAALGNSGQVLTSNGAGALPTFQPVTATAPTGTHSLDNLGLAMSASSGILTFNLKQADGSTAPASGAGAVGISMRSSTATSGAYNYRSITGALSQTLTSGTTLGMLASQDNYLWAYAVDSDGSGTMKLALSTVLYDDLSLQSTVAESVSATATNASPAVFTANGHAMPNATTVRLTGTPPTGFSTATNYYVVSAATNTFQLSATPGGTAINSSSTGSSIVVHVADASLVSDGVYAAKPIRFIGRAKFNLATSGTWLAPTEISLPTVDMASSFAITAKYYFGATATPGTTNPFNFDTMDFDSHGIVTTGSAWKTLVPMAGTYRVTITTGNANGTSSLVGLYKLGNNLAAYIFQSSSTTNINSGSVVMKFVARDWFDIRCDAGTQFTGSATPSRTTIAIERIGV